MYWLYRAERQDKTRQDKARQNKTRLDKARQDKTRQDKTRPYQTISDQTRQDVIAALSPFPYFWRRQARPLIPVMTNRPGGSSLSKLRSKSMQTILVVCVCVCMMYGVCGWVGGVGGEGGRYKMALSRYFFMKLPPELCRTSMEKFLWNQSPCFEMP